MGRTKSFTSASGGPRPGEAGSVRPGLAGDNGAMASANEEAAALLREYAELLGLTGGDPFRVRNYERAAKSVAGYPDDLGALPDSALTKIPGVGASTAAKIAEYRRTGSFKALDELRATVPPGALQLAKVPGVGPKRALQIARELGVISVGDLDEAVRDGRLRTVAGFGPKSEERILRGIAVAASDAALRDALHSLPLDATVDDIEAMLAAHVITATNAECETGAAAAGPPTTAREAGKKEAALVLEQDLRGDLHSHFDQDRKQMTRRFITACENPRVNIIGHPLTRKIGRRPPVDVDLTELFKACARTGTALEVNASPERLDLPSEHIRAAKDAGVKFAIDTDAHSVLHLANMPYGVGTAQRGWLTPDDVINTWPLDKLLAFLDKEG